MEAMNMANTNQPQGSQGPTDAEKKAAEADAKDNDTSDSKGVKMTYIGQFNGIATQYGEFKKDVTVVMPKKIADSLKKLNPGEFKFN